jgi:hypothetical protein
MKPLIALALLLASTAAHAKTFSKFECVYTVSIRNTDGSKESYESNPMEPWQFGGENGVTAYSYMKRGTGIRASAMPWAAEKEAHYLELSIMHKDMSVQSVAPIFDNGYVPNLIYSKRTQSGEESYTVTCKGIE